MTDQQRRLAALQRGASRASDASFVTVQVRDLRWLLDLVDASCRQPKSCDPLDLVDSPTTNFEMN